MTLSFSTDDHWNADRDIVKFHAMDGSKRILCAISRSALEDHFENGKTPLDTFRSNRSKIEAIAGNLILRGRFEVDGSILIKTSDLP
jgi:hypothetical protein